MKYNKTIVTLLLLLLMMLAALPPVLATTPEPSGPASITIHKYLVDSEKTLAKEQDGTKITDPDSYYVYENDTTTSLSDLSGLNGIQFTVTRVKDDTTSPDTAEPYAGTGEYRQNRITANIGGQDGIALFTDLPDGIYLVEERQSQDYTAETVRFLIQVPLPNPKGEGIVYDIHVYPKNTGARRSTDFTKRVGYRIGGDVTWECTWILPEVIGNNPKLTVTDPLNERLTYISTKIWYTNRAGVDTVLTEEYYNLSYNPYTHTVSIFIEEKGFQEIRKAYLPENGALWPKLNIQYDTTITSNAPGEIINSAEITYRDDNRVDPPYRPADDPKIEVENGVGGIRIYKIDGSTKQELAGAEFKVFFTRADAVAGINEIRNPNSTDGSWPATDENGILIIDGLPYKDNATSYWLRETKAPTANNKRYNLLSGPFEVTVGPDSHRKSHQVEVENRTGTTVPPGGGDPYNPGSSSSSQPPGGGPDNPGGPDGPDSPDDPGRPTEAEVPDSGGSQWSYLVVGLLFWGTAGALARKRY